jgi:hypothetical protein
VNTDFADDYDVLFQNDGTGFFTDVGYQAGIAESSIPFVKFGDGFLDYDNDGWKDLLIINGHVYPEVDKHPEWGTSYAERPLLYHNLKKGKFELVPAVEGTGLAVVAPHLAISSTTARSMWSSTIWMAFQCCFAT